MEQVKFSTFAYRALLNEKAKVIDKIDALYNEQNKHIFDALVADNIITEDLSMPVGIIPAPANGKNWSEEEVKHNEKVLIKFAEAYKDKGFVNTTLISIEEYETLLTITPTDIAKCIEP